MRPEYAAFVDSLKTIKAAQLAEMTGGTNDHVHAVIHLHELPRRLMYPELALRVFPIRCHGCDVRCWFDPQSTVAPGSGRIFCLVCVGGGAIDNLDRGTVIMPDASVLHLATLMERQRAREERTG